MSQPPSPAVRAPGDDADVRGDAELVQAVRAGDAHAFAALYGRYVGRVFRFCLSRLRSVEEAEDVTAVVFAKVVQALPRYQERGVPFAAWVYRVARNAVVDHVRRRRPTIPLEALSAEPARGEAAEPDPVALSDREELRRALARLPDLHREVLVLRFVEGYEAAEVGRIVGKNVGAVRSIQHRALAQLREELSRGEMERK